MNRSPDKPARIAFLLSGAGRTLQNLMELIEGKGLHAEIALVLSSNPAAIGVARARQARLPIAIVERKVFAEAVAFSDEITRQIEAAKADLVCMGGFLHLWKFPKRYEGKVLNIHPSLLPKFGGRNMFGAKVHAAVLAAREKETGCTVHFCDLEYDHGPTILQRKVKVLPDDTPEALAERVFEAERVAYPEAIRMVIEGKARYASEKPA